MTQNARDFSRGMNASRSCVSIQYFFSKKVDFCKKSTFCIFESVILIVKGNRYYPVSFQPGSTSPVGIGVHFAGGGKS